MIISRKLAVGVLGTLMLTIGIVGLVVPVLPGWLLIIAGLAVLRTEFRWADRLAGRARARRGNETAPKAGRDKLAA